MYSLTVLKSRVEVLLSNLRVRGDKKWMRNAPKWSGLLLLCLCFSVGSLAEAETKPKNSLHPKKRVRKYFVSDRLMKTHSPLMTHVYRIRNGGLAVQKRSGTKIRMKGEVRAVPYLLGLLKMRQVRRQRGALVVLGDLRIPWMEDVFKTFLKSKNRLVRMAAMEGLEKLGSKKGRKILVERAFLATHSEASSALRALSASGSLKALQSLKKNKQDLRKRLGWRSSLTLANLGHKASQGRWIKAYQDKNAWAGARLAEWPGTWGKSFLKKEFKKAKPMQRDQIIRWLLKRPTSKSLGFAIAVCKKKKLSASRCRWVRFVKRRNPRFPKIPRPFFLMKRAKIQKIQKEIHHSTSNFYKRLERLSRKMLGTPYKLDALGEGRTGKVDQDPRFSFKELDCVTFLEEQIGLTTYSQIRKADRYTQKIRYMKGKISYQTRKHLPIAQWIPSLQKQGVVVDITRSIGGAKTRTLTKKITHASYQNAKALARRLGRKNLVTGTFTLPYLPLSVVLANVKKIPVGTIISVIRPLSSKTPAQVSHQGMVVRMNGKMYMRHSTIVWKSVVDTPLKWFVQSLMRYRNGVLGLHFLRIKSR